MQMQIRKQILATKSQTKCFSYTLRIDSLATATGLRMERWFYSHCGNSFWMDVVTKFANDCEGDSLANLLSHWQVPTRHNTVKRFARIAKLILLPLIKDQTWCLLCCPYLEFPYFSLSLCYFLLFSTVWAWIAEGLAINLGFSWYMTFQSHKAYVVKIQEWTSPNLHRIYSFVHIEKWSWSYFMATWHISHIPIAFINTGLWPPQSSRTTYCKA